MGRFRPCGGPLPAAIRSSLFAGRTVLAPRGIIVHAAVAIVHLPYTALAGHPG
jgi:hypothetical protein